MPTWRDRARSVIASVLAESKAAGLDRAATIVAINVAYPFDERLHYPYKVWLSERKRAIATLGDDGKPRPCPTCGAKPNLPCVDIGGELAVGGRHLARTP